MTDSMDIKPTENRGNLDVDLDALLDQAESSLLPINEFQDDDETIDRLLMDKGFDTGEGDMSSFDTLDDFSDFSDFDGPDSVPALDALQAAEDSSVVEDDDFSSLSDDFDESDLIINEEAEGAAETITPVIVEESLQEEGTAAIEEPDEFAGFADDFDGSDLLLDYEKEGAADLIAPALVEESLQEEGAAALEEPDEFAGFGDDFDGSDLLLDYEKEGAAETITPALVEESLQEEGTAALEEPDEFAGFADDFDESVLIINDEAEGAADLIAPALVEESLQEEGAAALEEPDEFAGFADDFDESALIQAEGAEATVAPDEEPMFDQLSDDDNVLLDADFEAEDELESSIGEQHEFGDDADLNEMDDFFQLDQISDDFSKPTEDARLAETEKATTQGDDFLLPDFDITADMEVSDAGIQNEADAWQTLEPETLSGIDAATKSAPNQSVGAEVVNQENIKLSAPEDLKNQPEDAEIKIKKAKRQGYLALGFGAVALSAAAGLGVMTYSAKTEVAKLTAAVSTLEASLAKIVANNPDAEMSSLRNAVSESNQQLDGFITELKGNPQFPVDLLDSKLPEIVSKQDRISKALVLLQTKIGGPNEPMPIVAELPKVESGHEPQSKEPAVHEPVPEPVKEKAGHEHTQTKEQVAHEPAPAPAPASASASVKEKAAHEHAAAKEKIPAPIKIETAQTKEKTQSQAVTAKPVTLEKSIPKQMAAKVKRPVATANWGVNLVAFKQEWFAKSKAAEFARLGVFAEVIPVHENNGTLYRLRADGFKSKAEANANTARIKNALNLDSVWVSEN